MPHFDANAQPSLSEPISFTVGDPPVKYTVKEMTEDFMDDVTSIKREEGDDPKPRILCRQLGKLTGADPDKFASINVQKLGAIISFVMDSILY